MFGKVDSGLGFSFNYLSGKGLLDKKWVDKFYFRLIVFQYNVHMYNFTLKTVPCFIGPLVKSWC